MLQTGSKKSNAQNGECRDFTLHLYYTYSLSATRNTDWLAEVLSCEAETAVRARGSLTSQPPDSDVSDCSVENATDKDTLNRSKDNITWKSNSGNRYPMSLFRGTSNENIVKTFSFII